MAMLNAESSFEGSTPVSIAATDGFALGATSFGSDRTRALVIAPALGVPRAYYRRFASFVAARGWRVVTFDYRGIGGSRPDSLRGFEANMLDWAEKDLAGVIAHAKERLRADRLAVVGHSFGGAALGLAPNAAKVDALVAIGSGLGDLDLYPAPERYAFKAFMGGVIPALATTMGYFPGKLGAGEDLPRGVALQWARWALSRDFFLGGKRAPRRDRFANMTAPARLYSFDDDWYAPRVVVDALAKVYDHAPVERRHVASTPYGGIGHFGFFRPRFERSLWPEVEAFLSGREERTAPGGDERGDEQALLDQFMFDRHNRSLS